MLASNTAPALLIFAASYALFRKFSASLANQDLHLYVTCTVSTYEKKNGIPT